MEYTKDKFILPEAWYVKVTDDNVDVLSRWRFGNDYNKLDNTKLVGINKWFNKYNQIYKLEKGHNPYGVSSSEDYDFGIEITYNQFLKYVLNQEISERKQDYNYIIAILEKYSIK
jgi:hypothetical protein